MARPGELSSGRSARRSRRRTGPRTSSTSRFDKMASKIRTEVNASIREGIHDRMSPVERAGLLRLLEERDADSTTLFNRLKKSSKKNATYAAFREVGRVIRTVQLLRYLSDPALRRRVTAATNKTEAFNGFSQWLGFGNRGVIADSDPIEQEKAMKFNALLTNAVIFHNALDIAEIVRQLLEEGWTIEPEDMAPTSRRT
ncbi:Tn3 family transposase [Streptomyces sp. NPDC002285]